MKALIKRNIVWVIFCGSSITMLVIALAVSQVMITSAETIEETSKQNILALSRAAALLVSADEMDDFVVPEDGQKPEYTALRHKLATFNEISGTVYTYFLRLDEETNMMQFIIDNTLEESIALSLPQVPREYAPDIALSGVANAVELGSYSEGWEGYMTAFAPVYNSDGSSSNVVAGVDMLDVYIWQTQKDMGRLSVLLVISIALVLGACLSSLILYQQKARQALLASEAKSSFLSNTSHEIRTPMNAILGMADLIVHEETSDTVRLYATDIRNACRGLLTIINDILDISKIESGKLEITPAKYQLSSLLLDTISIVRMRTKEKQLTFSVSIDPNIPSELIGDEMRIKQILVNLLNNAVKFTHEGQIALSMHCVIDGDVCRLLFSVKDTGIGIRASDIDNIFVLFEQVDTKVNRNIEGTGLGLSISKQLIEMMDGSIHVESEYGVGSTFTASIVQQIANMQPIIALKYPERNSVLVYENRPAYLDAVTYTLDSLGCHYVVCTNRSEMYYHLGDAKFDYLFVSSLNIDNIRTAATQKQPDAIMVVLDGDGDAIHESISISMPIHCLQIANILNDEFTDTVSDFSTADLTAPDAKVLVVDDNAVNLKVAVGLLNIYGIQADTADSGMRAIQMVTETDYDLVFMDHMMPEMDGIDATVAIRALGDKYAKLPIVALTANAIGGVKEMFKAEGLDDFVAKPIEMKKLYKILCKWLPENKQRTKESLPSPEAVRLDIPGLNAQEGVKNSGGTLHAYDEILAVYAADSAERLSDMVKHYKGNDIAALTICVHALKSASASIGADELSSKAAVLEAAGKAGDMGYIEANLQSFTDSLSSLLDAIHSYLKDAALPPPKQKLSGDLTLLKASLDEIERRIDELDIDAVERQLSELYALSWDDDVFGQISNMKGHLDTFDYDGLAKACNQLREML